VILGIDPGVTGGLASISKGQVALSPFKSLAKEFDYWQATEVIKKQWGRGGEHRIEHAFVEKAQAMPKNGAVGMFKYGAGFGCLIGILTTLGVPFTLVPPRTWTKVMHEGTSGNKPKERSKQAVQRLFPMVDLTLDGQFKKPHEGVIDALLIAEYGRRKLNG